MIVSSSAFRMRVRSFFRFDGNEPLVGNCAPQIVEKTFRDRLDLTCRTFAPANGRAPTCHLLFVESLGLGMSIRHK